MITLTYVVLVLGVLVVLWVVLRRRPGANLLGRDTPAAGGAGRDVARGWSGRASLRTVLTGVARPSADLVERMAQCLVAGSTSFGSSFAIPSYLAAVLPKGVFAAASAIKPQLTAEVLERFIELMSEHMRRGGRGGYEFTLPAHYTLRLVLTCGASEAVLASFEPVVDVHAALRQAGLNVPLPAVAVDGGIATSRRRDALLSGGGAATTRRRSRADEPVGQAFALFVGDIAQAQRSLGGRTSVLTIGRAAAADLRCADDLADVSRIHAELTCAHGAVYIEDKHSANGTWLQRDGAAPELLVPGELVEVHPADIIWLDEDHRAKVIRL